MKSIFQIASELEISLLIREATGEIKNPVVEVIPDDNAVNVFFQRIKPLKNIKLNLNYGKKGNSDEWVRITQEK